MSIAAIVCRGFGPAASVPFVVTRGFSIGVAPAPPSVTPPVGSSISGGTFSRGRWRSLKEELRGEREVRDRAIEARRKTERKALEQAAAETAKARAAIDTDESEHEAALVRLSNALDAAAGAQSIAVAIQRANEATRIAKAIQSEIEDDDEEEEAIAILLMH